MLTICAQGIVVKLLMLMLELGLTNGRYVYIYREKKFLDSGITTQGVGTSELLVCGFERVGGNYNDLAL